MIGGDVKRSMRRSAMLPMIVASLLTAGGLTHDAMAQRAVPLRQTPAGDSRTRTPQERQALERRVRQMLGRVVRRELKLDDQGMRRLQESDAKFDQQRRTLLRDERATRQSLRGALEDSTSDPGKISQLMNQLIQVQRRRIDLLEAEQKELSGFLSPRQRAQYVALRERLTQQMSRIQPGGGRGGRRGEPPPA